MYRQLSLIFSFLKNDTKSVPIERVIPMLILSTGLSTVTCVFFFIRTALKEDFGLIAA